MFTFEIDFGHSVLYLSQRQKEILGEISFEMRLKDISVNCLEDEEILIDLASLPKNVRKVCNNAFRIIEKEVAIEFRRNGTYRLTFVDGSIPWNIFTWRPDKSEKKIKVALTSEVRLVLNPYLVYVLFIPSKEQGERSPESPQ